MKDVVFTTYSFGELYCYQQDRLRESILKIYPDANLRFWKDESGSSEGQPGRPTGARTFHDSMYGFKVHCVKNCLMEGFSKIIFLDAAIILEGKIDNILENAAEYGVLVCEERTELNGVISDVCRSYAHESDIDSEDIDNINLVGGSIYVFDFNVPVTARVFDMWYELEQVGMFGNEVDDAQGRLQGHRKDETCMALALYKHGVSALPHDMLGYHNLGTRDENARFTFYKLHFKGIGQVHEHSLNQSLIPLHGNILDLGCRDFIFTDFFKSQEYNVVSVDIGKFEGSYHRFGISHENGWCYCQDERDPDATHITHREVGDKIPMVTIETLSKMFGIKHWDLIKMDIEMAEYEVLKQGKHPMASQICVEFHAHCGQTKEQLDELLDMLSEYYEIYGRDWKEEHSAGFNYWDVLLIAK